MNILEKSTFFVSVSLLFYPVCSLFPDENETREMLAVSRRMQIESVENIVLSGKVMMLERNYRQGIKGEIVIEAETGSKTVTDDNPALPWGILRRDKACGGGAAAHFLKSGTYIFEVGKTAKMTFYYRTFFPFAANWLHSEKLDKEPAESVRDLSPEQTDSVKKWAWQKGRTVDLSPGVHSLTLDFQGGAAIDQIALLPESTVPPSDLPMQATFDLKKSLKGNAIFSGFSLSPDKKDTAVTFSAELNGGVIDVDYSLDNGLDWVPLPSDGKLPEVKEPTGLKLRVSISSGKVTDMPMLRDLKIKYFINSKSSLKESKLDSSMLQEASEIRLIPSTWKNLRPEQNGNFKMTNPVQADSKNVVVMYPKDADNLIIAPAGQSWFMKDDDATFGDALYQGIYNRNIISFDFNVAKDGSYRPYFRVKFKETGALKVLLDFNRNEGYVPFSVYNFDNEKIIVSRAKQKGYSYGQKWFWLPGETVKLNKGNHVFRLRGGLEYMLLDAISLQPDDYPVPSALGGPGPSLRKPLENAQIGFQPVHGILKNTHTSQHNDNLDISYDISFDNGKTWKELKSAADYPRENTCFKIRANINSSKAVAVAPDFFAEISGKREIVLANKEQKIFFDADTGNLSGWEVPGKGFIIGNGVSVPLFSFKLGNYLKGFYYCEPARSDLVARKTYEENGTKHLELSYLVEQENINVLVKISLPPNGLPMWQLTVANDSVQDIKDIEFPRFEAVRLGNDPERTRATILRSLCGFDFPGAPLGLLKNFTGGTYPGGISMGYLALYAPGFGSFTAQNRNADGIGVGFSQKPSPEHTSLDIAMNRRYNVDPHSSTTIKYAAGYHPGNEHDSAMKYSEWANSWMDFSRVNSNWAKYLDGCMIDELPFRRSETNLIPQAEWLGIGLYWHIRAAPDIPASCSCIPYISPMLGTADLIRKGHEKMREAKVRNVYYWNSRGWSEDYSTTDHVGVTLKKYLPDLKILPPESSERLGAKNEAGLLRSYGFLVNAGIASQDNTICNASKGWQDYQFYGMVDNYSKMFGADGVYSDEANLYYECYDSTHEHGKQYGMKMPGLGEAFRRILDNVRKHSPDFIINIEGSVDYLLQYADFGLRVNPDYCDGAPLLYAFPQTKFFRGMANGFIDGIRNPAEFQRDIHLFSRTDAMAYADNIRQFFTHRKRIKDWMYDGTFKDDEDLTISQPGVIAKYFLRNTDEHMGVLVNIKNEFQTDNAVITIKNKGLDNTRKAYAYLMEEESIVPVSLSHQDGTINFIAPTAKASSVLLPVRFPVNESIRTALVWPQKPGHDHLVAYIVNMSEYERKVSCSLTLPKEIKTLDHIPDEISLQKGEIYSKIIRFTGRNGMNRHGYATLNVSEAAPSSAIIAPHISNRGFESHQPDRTSPDMWCAGKHYFTGFLLAQRMKIPFDLNAMDGVLDSVLPYEGKLSLKLDGQSEQMPFPATLAGPWGTLNYPEEKPMMPWYFNTEQQMILKPSTKYLLKFAYRFADDDGLLLVQSFSYTERKDQTALLFKPQQYHALKNDRGWRTAEISFETPNGLFSSYATPLVFVNKGKNAAWIDDIILEEI